MKQPTNSEYVIIHRWLRESFGSANKCELCMQKDSKVYDWALKKGFEYEKKRDNFMQLCRSCHAKYDETHKNLPSRKGVPASIESILASRKAIIQYDRYGNFIKEFNSSTNAAKELNINRGNMSAVALRCNKYRRTAGGFIFKFKTV